MTSLFLVLALLAQAPASTAASAVARINAKVRVEPVPAADVKTVAGRYSRESAELEEFGGPPLSGDDLYLFPDGTYVYTEWADIMPTTVYDKGRWTVQEDGLVRLSSDRDITWKHRLERRFALFRRERRGGEVLLMGFDRQLREYVKDDGFLHIDRKKIPMDPVFILLLNCRSREEVYGPDPAKVKADLMRKTWNPSFFRKDVTRILLVLFLLTLAVPGWGQTAAASAKQSAHTDPCRAKIPDSIARLLVQLRAPRHRDHLFHAIVITHSTAS